jgi:glycerate kinase
MLEPPGQPAPVELDVLCDVDHRLVGERGAAAVFGPQKGLDAQGVGLAARGLENWAACLQAATGRDVRSIPGGGAAGGLPAALAAACGARLLPGFEAVARYVRLDEHLDGCRWCLTGEGRLDEQTAGGKVVAGVAALAAQRKVPAVAFVGQLRLAASQTAAQVAAALRLAEIVTITPVTMALDEALRQTADQLALAARHWLAGRAIATAD